MNQPQPSYTRDQLVAFLAAWMKTNPELTLSAARIEGMARGYTVGRREYEEARRIGTGSPIHPEHVSIATFDAQEASDRVAAPAFVALPKRVPETANRQVVAATDDRAWFVSFLKKRPTASFAEVNAAAVAAGVRPTTPIGFGLARKAAGIASVTKPKVKRLPVPAPAVVADASVSEAAPTPSRASERNTSSVFADIERLMADYGRLREALIEISRIVRSAGAD